MSNKPFRRDQIVRHAITRDLGEIGSKPIVQADGSTAYDVYWESKGHDITEEMLLEPLDRADLQYIEELRSQRRYDPYPKQKSIHHREQVRLVAHQSGKKIAFGPYRKGKAQKGS